MFRNPLRSCLVLILVATASFAQSKPPVAPLPSDPLELATGPVLPLDNPDKRSLVLGLLEHARQNAQLYEWGGPGFDLKMSLVSSGESRYTGSGDMEELRVSPDTWRWTAHLGDYSQNRVFYQGVVYDDKTPGPIPLRVQMARSAIFWPMNVIMPRVQLRMATAKWQGLEVMCALVSRANAESDTTSGRRWHESEYCVDPKSGLLRIASVAPGAYNVYDYAETLKFHDRVLPRTISMVEDRNTVMEIRLQSIEDLNASTASQFTPTKQMISHGSGIILRGPMLLEQSAAAPAGYHGPIQPVTVHASVDNQGKIEEAEALQTVDSALSNAALAIVKKNLYPPQQGGKIQREVFINVNFVPGT